jgi:hypothetical protein
MAELKEINYLMDLYQRLEAETRPQERRRHPRSAVKGRVPATLEVAGTAPLAVGVRDLSRSGIGLLSPRPIKVGERVVVGFELENHPVRATCRVANCREGEKGRYIVGLAFIEIQRPQRPAPPLGSGEMPEGQMLSAKEAMEGVDARAVNEVAQRLARLLSES